MQYDHGGFRGLVRGEEEYGRRRAGVKIVLVFSCDEILFFLQLPGKEKGQR